MLSLYYGSKIFYEVIFMVRVCLERKLKEIGISRYELSKRSGVQYQVVDNYYKNRAKRYDQKVLDRICTALDCEIGDVIEYVKD